jgi:hypothetical protein
MNKIEKLSRFFKWVFTVIFWVWPVVLLLIWLPDPKSFLGGIGLIFTYFFPRGLDLNYLIVHHSLPLPLMTKILGLLVSVLPAFVGMFISFSLMRLFTCYEKGVVFTQESIASIHRVGVTLFLWTLLNPIYQILMSAVLTWDKSVYGDRQISFAFGFDYLENLILAGIVFLIAHIMREAIKLKEEQSLTV